MSITAAQRIEDENELNLINASQIKRLKCYWTSYVTSVNQYECNTPPPKRYNSVDIHVFSYYCVDVQLLMSQTTFSLWVLWLFSHEKKNKGNASRRSYSSMLIFSFLMILPSGPWLVNAIKSDIPRGQDFQDFYDMSFLWIKHGTTNIVMSLCIMFCFITSNMTSKLDGDYFLEYWQSMQATFFLYPFNDLDEQAKLSCDSASGL